MLCISQEPDAEQEKVNIEPVTTPSAAKQEELRGKNSTKRRKLENGLEGLPPTDSEPKAAADQHAPTVLPEVEKKQKNKAKGEKPKTVEEETADGPSERSDLYLTSRPIDGSQTNTNSPYYTHVFQATCWQYFCH